MNGNSFGHDFAHALTARSVDDEYRQIDRLYGPRGRSWQFVQQALSMAPSPNPSTDPRRYDVVTIRLANGETRRVHFDITSFVGKWPDHAAGRILPGAEMQASEITGAGQASGPSFVGLERLGTTVASIAFVGLAGLVAFGIGQMAGYRGVYRSNPCGCQHGSSG